MHIFSGVFAFFLSALFAFGFSRAHAVDVSISSYPWKYRSLAEMLSEIKCCQVRKITVFDGLRIGGDSEIAASKFGWRMGSKEREVLKGILAGAGVEVFSYSNMSLTDASEIEEVFRFAKEMGISMVSVEAPAQFLPLYDACSAKYGVRAGIYNHGNPNSRYLTPEMGIAALERNPHLELLPDCGHWGRAKFDILQMLEKSSGKFSAINIQDINPDGSCAAYGTGILPLREFLKSLFFKHKFSGTAIVMFDVSPNPIEKILPSIKFLRGIEKEYSVSSGK